MKKTILLLLVLTYGFTACNLHSESEDQQNQPAASEYVQKADSAVEDTAQSGSIEKTNFVDSFKLEMDSLMDADIKLPPVYAHEILSANNEATEKFSKLSKACNGTLKIVVNSSMVSKEVAHTINSISVPKSDLLFLIDKTYSMVDDIANVKVGLAQIMDTIKKYKGTRLAVALYGDKTTDGLGWYVFRNFGTDYGRARDFIDSIQVGGGGSYWPESVYEAVLESIDNPFWQSAKRRNIILIGDAPPFEMPFSHYTIDDVINRVRQNKVVMNFYPIVITPDVRQAKVSAEEQAKYQPEILATSLYPNPTKGHIDIGFKENGTYYVEIYNVAGEMVVSQEAYGISWGTDLGDVPDGMYILRVINKEHKFELHKFILRR